MIIGFGNVGQAFFRLLNLKRDLLGVDVYVSEIIDRRRGHIVNPGPGVVDDARSGKLLGKRVDIDEVPPRLIEGSDADIVCEFTDLNVKDRGEPAFTYLSTAIRSGKHVITTNKAQ